MALKDSLLPQKPLRSLASKTYKVYKSLIPFIIAAEDLIGLGMGAMKNTKQDS